MKNLIFILSLTLCQSNALFANNIDSIPNSGFERWYSLSWYYNPAGWQTNNTSIMPTTVEPDSDSYSGNLAMRLINSGGLVPEASVGFHVQQHPLTLSGFVRNQILTNDSAHLSVKLYLHHQLIDSGTFAFYGGINPFYHSFAIPISQNFTSADSCEIRIFGGQQSSSSISFDELALTRSSGTNSKADENKLKVYPNPSSSFIRVDFSETFSEDAAIEIYDINGKLVAGKNLLNNIIAVYNQKSSATLMIEQQALAPGIYTLNIKTSGRSYTTKIVRN